MLKTYPQLNLPTKRGGIDADDWKWVAVVFMITFMVKNLFVMLVLPTITYVWFWKFKSKLPRGWLSAAGAFYMDHLLGQRHFQAELEDHANTHIPRH